MHTASQRNIYNIYYLIAYCLNLRALSTRRLNSTHSSILSSHLAMSIITSNSHTAPTPIFTSMYTILALAFISISILGVFCYSVYRCYCSAVYQTRREWEIEQEQRLRERKSDEKGVRVLECEGRDLKANWTRCRSGTDCKVQCLFIRRNSELNSLERLLSTQLPA